MVFLGGAALITPEWLWLPRAPHWKDGIHESKDFSRCRQVTLRPAEVFFRMGWIDIQARVWGSVFTDLQMGRGEIEEWKPPTMGDSQQHAHSEGSGFILCGKPAHRLAQQLWVRWLSAKVAFSPPSRQPWGQRGCMIASVCYITLTWWRILSWGLK